MAALAAATGQQMQAVVDEAVSAYERSVFWQRFESGYEELAEDPQRWSEAVEERAGEERSLPDGLS